MDRKVSVTYKMILAAAAVIGILLQCGVGTAHFSLSSFRMFTTLSNFAVAVFFGADAVIILRGKSPLPKCRCVLDYIKFAVTMAILLTGLVAHFMLRGMFAGMDPMGKAGLTLLHYVVPVGTLLDWILFDEKGRTTRKMRWSPLCFRCCTREFLWPRHRFFREKTSIPIRFWTWIVWAPAAFC